MLATVVAVVLLGLAAAAPEGQRQPETKQLVVSGIGNTNNCPNTFQLTSNPCASGQGRGYYAISNDLTKFVQCDALGRAYVVQCPSGLVFNQATTSCLQQQVVTQAPVVNTPCTSQALATGQIYFTFPGDNTKFYECTAVGQAQVLQCPNNLVWQASRNACVYRPGSTVINPTVYPQTQQYANPCTPQQLAAGNYYFPNPDPTHFIQCDDAGEAFDVACPSGLVWNQYYQVCASTFAQGSVIPGTIINGAVGK